MGVGKQVLEGGFTWCKHGGNILGRDAGWVTGG